jgi:hypothetical protein
MSPDHLPSIHPLVFFFNPSNSHVTQLTALQWLKYSGVNFIHTEKFTAALAPNSPTKVTGRNFLPSLHFSAMATVRPSHPTAQTPHLQTLTEALSLSTNCARVS